MLKSLATLIISLLIIPFMAVYSTVDGGESRQTGTRQDVKSSSEEQVSEIVDKLKKRYGGESFSADFYQESTLAALNISDTAEGRAWFKHPGKMRWEYHMPDEHAIITDGDTLWIYRPEENQVVKGDATTYFGDGKGAGFLANFDLVTESFDVSLADQTRTHWRMKLVPHEEHYELSAIYLVVNKQSTEIEHVISENIYKDTTTISFANLSFDGEPDNSLFEFEIPMGTDVILMD